MLFLFSRPGFSRLLFHQQRAMSSASVKEITPRELNALFQKSKNDPFRRTPKLIDARERHEIEQHGKIMGATNIPFGVFLKDRPTYSAAMEDAASKNATTLVVHCMSGRRSHEVVQHAMQLGYTDVYNLVGGFKQWRADGLAVQPFQDDHSPWVRTIFEQETETAQYIVADVETKEAYILDPVLDYDPFSSSVRPTTAKQIVDQVTELGLKVSKIIDTHVHADHLTAAEYLRNHLPTKPEFWIGSRVTDVQKVFSKIYNLPEGQLNVTGNQFDHLVKEGYTWTLGNNIKCTAINTPGHTPACMSYRVGDAAFVGDTLFMPDIGTARCDFPGGSAETMYASIHKMYDSWPADTRIYVGHDYPPPGSGRSYEVMTTLEAHKQLNVMINENVPMEEYIKLRAARDKKLRAPRFIHPSLQTNLRGGCLPENEKTTEGAAAGKFFKIPVRWVST